LNSLFIKYLLLSNVTGSPLNYAISRYLHVTFWTKRRAKAISRCNRGDHFDLLYFGKCVEKPIPGYRSARNTA